MRPIRLTLALLFSIVLLASGQYSPLSISALAPGPASLEAATVAVAEEASDIDQSAQPISGQGLLGFDVTVSEDRVENRFPRDLRFSLKGTTKDQIKSATLYYRIASQARRSYANLPADSLGNSGELSLEYTLDLKRNYMPPGVDLQYQWRLTDQSDARFETGWRAFRLDDPRFKWQSLSVGQVELLWYKGGDSFGEALREPTVAAVKLLQAQAGITADKPVRILFYATDSDFQAAAGPGTNEWAGGRAFVREGVVIIQASPDSLEYAKRTVPHELSHVIVYNATRNPYGGLPSWLDEGLAMLAEGEQDPSFRLTLTRAIRDDKLISVWSLSSNFPTDTREAELSYAQSYSLAKFVVNTYGQTTMSRLLSVFREGATYDDGLKAALGVDTYGLEDAWRASLGLKPLPSLAPVKAY